ncbi:ATP-binding protein [Desulfospira joergensenii]|uniref:ATP-binding protein n=1 Tax=Desulfospira joergensenii TaxID=53329 RepID=UPI0003B3D8EA|nr:ATP-binding protein [Desulfospira joergensenii]
MNKKEKSFNGDLQFAEESSILPGKSSDCYKLLIVDDENEVHVMTKLVLSDYEYQGMGLEFLSAFSGEEAKAMIKKDPGIACILLDVVMETEDAGLEVAKFIRETENNQKIRIILRTGQPGKAPEKKIILNYDINDYKEKTELTTQKLFTTVTTALRSYSHLTELEEKTKEIESKNLRLNEEIARRIVAESNLTKYNRSLEKMIQIKSARLEKALITLETQEIEFLQARKVVMVSDISSASLATLHESGNQVMSNLNTIDNYRQEITLLLEKYQVLQEIINSRKKMDEVQEPVVKTIQEINHHKTRMDLENILKVYPEIIEDSARGIEQISQAVSDMRLIIESGQEPARKTDVNLIIEDVLKEMKNSFDTKVEVQMNLGEVPEISLPETGFKTAVTAVIKNGFQAMETRGIISVSTRYQDREIIIGVSDVGCGILPEHLPHVFKPYFTGEKKNSKGLGLSLARHIILNCNGDIDITSTPREGTSVVLRLKTDRSRKNSEPPQGL